MAVFPIISYWLVLSFGELIDRRPAGNLNQTSVILKNVLPDGLWAVVLTALLQVCF